MRTGPTVFLLRRLGSFWLCRNGGSPLAPLPDVPHRDRSNKLAVEETGTSAGVRGMKYWTLFTLRMLARVGLLLAIVLWVLGQQRITPDEYEIETGAFSSFSLLISLGTTQLIVDTCNNALVVVWEQNQRARFSIGNIEVNSVAMPGANTLDAGPYGIRIDSVSYIQTVLVVVAHWFVCLTFLIATVATHWQWRKPATVQENDV